MCSVKRKRPPFGLGYVTVVLSVGEHGLPMEQACTLSLKGQPSTTQHLRQPGHFPWVFRNEHSPFKYSFEKENGPSAEM